MSEANDFLVDGIYTFEIGGKRKRYSPIEGIPDGFIVADEHSWPPTIRLSA